MSKWRRVLQMVSLVFAGESVYLLPYALGREYEKEFLSTMGVSGPEYGDIQFAFGVLAMICYLPGGWLADRVSARKLLTVSLVSTSAGGLYLLTFPGYWGLVGVHAFWGTSSILTFWAALVKATRAWGGAKEQGRAFGILEGGRGLVGAVLPTIGLVSFAWAGSTDAGLRGVITLYSVAGIGVAVLTWLFIPEQEQGAGEEESAAGAAESSAPEPRHEGQNQLLTVVRMPVVWLLALVIFTGYLGYRGTFNLAAFSKDAYGMGDVMGSAVSLMALWVRAVVAVTAGFVADKLGASRTVMGAFAIMIVVYAGFTLLPTNDSTVWLLWTNTALLAAAAYGLRGLFYALLGEGRIPTALTGTAVGLVSIIGYTPDVFTRALKNRLIDDLGVAGHHYYFAMLGAMAVAGLLAAYGIRRLGARAAAREQAAAAEAG